MTTAKAVSRASEGAERVPEERQIEIRPEAVRLNEMGQMWRNLLVRTPPDLVSDDLRDPSIWRQVQSSQSALIRYDHLLLMAHDESWYARAIVVHADNRSARLHIEKVSTFRDPSDEQLFSDGVYEVFWRGDGYCIRRCVDQVQAGNTVYFTADQARNAISSLYPKKVG